MTFQEKIPPLVYQLSFMLDDSQHLPLVRGVLLTVGIKLSNITEDIDSGVPSLRVYFPTKPELDRVKALFQRLALKHLTINSKIMRPKDWASRWKKHWKPARLTRLLDVVPVWCHKDYHKIRGRKYILMDTLLSFGTGLHETTQIVSQMIEDHCQDIKTLMDIGTGTGVLSMVALKHGVSSVMAIDIGDLSVAAAKNNLKVNGLKGKVIKADINHFKHQKYYDFVAANLVTQDLITSKHKILRFVKPGGFLAVSGISLPNCIVFEKSFVDKSLVLIQSIKAKEWAGYLYQKKK